MMISFTLLMPNVGSWNGKWTGAENLYARVKTFNTKKGREKAESLKRYYNHNFGDGWSAGVIVEEVDRTKAAKIRRHSKGFCGYDWMIDSIMDHGRIFDSAQQKEMRCPNTVYHYHVEQGIEPDGNCMACQKKEVTDESN